MISFHRRVWYRALSVCYACVRSSGIFLAPCATFVPNFVSFAASIAELAHGEKSRTQSITHPADLMPRKPEAQDPNYDEIRASLDVCVRARVRILTGCRCPTQVRVTQVCFQTCHT